MKQFQYTIKDELGVHARPAGLLVKLAKQYTSRPAGRAWTPSSSLMVYWNCFMGRSLLINERGMGRSRLRLRSRSPA